MNELTYQMGVLQEKEYYETMEKLWDEYYQKHPIKKLLHNIKMILLKSHKRLSLSDNERRNYDTN